MIAFGKFRPRILPVAIALTMIGIGTRTVDLISMAVTGNGLSPVTEAAAQTPAAPAADASKKPSTDAKTQMASAEAPTPGMPSHPPEPEATQQENELLTTLTEKHKELDARAQQLDQREALLNAAEGRINKKIEELSGMRTDLEKLLDLQKSKDAAQMASLIKIYENMKPKDAAEIFNNLDLPVLVDVSAGMKEAKLAPVLADMSPERARMLTVKLAEHRRNMEGAVADAKAALGGDTPAPGAAADPNAPAPPTDGSKP